MHPKFKYYVLGQVSSKPAYKIENYSSYLSTNLYLINHKIERLPLYSIYITFVDWVITRAFFTNLFKLVFARLLVVLVLVIIVFLTSSSSMFFISIFHFLLTLKMLLCLCSNYSFFNSWSNRDLCNSSREIKIKIFLFLNSIKSHCWIYRH